MKKGSVVARFHIFALVYLIKNCINDTVSRFEKAKEDNLIMAATYLFGDIIIIHLLRTEEYEEYVA